jgi:hypothetical protein
MESTSQSRNQRRTTYLAIGALGIALVAAAFLLVSILQGGSGADINVAQSAKLMPADSFSFTAFNPHLDQAKNFNVLKAWVDNAQIQQALAEMQSSMQAAGIDYRTDIQPWLGDEVGLGMDPEMLSSVFMAGERMENALSGEFDAAQAPQMTIALATKDKGASDQFLAKLRAKAEEQVEMVLKETEYKNIPVVYSEPQSQGEPGFAYATVGDFVVITVGGLEPMQAAIDAWEGDNLTTNQNYKDVLDKLPAEQMGYGYLDMAAYTGALSQAAATEMADLPADLYDTGQFEAIKAVGYSAGLASDGIQVDFVAVYDKAALPEQLAAIGAIAGKTAERAPGDTLFYVSGSGLDQFLKMGLDMAKSMDEGSGELDEQLEMGTAMLGLSMDDLIGMLSGEYAVMVAPDPSGLGGDASMPVGVGVLLEAQDQEKFEKLLNSVNTLLAFDGETALSEETINGVNVVTMANPDGSGMVAGWGVGNGFFAGGTNDQLLQAAFGGASERLVDNALFKAATKNLPSQYASLSFVNVEGLLDTMSRALPTVAGGEEQSFDEARPLLDPIKAIAAATEPFSTSKTWSSGKIFFLIKTE